MSSKRVLIPLAEGCEELETVTLIDVLRRAGIEVVTASLSDNPQVTASRGVRLVADTTLEAVLDNSFDMVVLPGGQPGTNNLNADTRLHHLFKQMHENHHWIGAICAAPLVLAQAGLLAGRKATCYPGVLEPTKWPEIELCQDAVMCDHHIITSRGPGTAMAFALLIIEKLVDVQTRQNVEAGLVIY